MIPKMSQRDWYAQAGISWHMAAFQRVVKNDKNEPEIISDVYISFLEDDSIQDATSVFAIVMKNLEMYQKGHKEAKEVFIISDNAACYKSERGIRWFYEKRNINGMKIKAVKFSEPGMGKSICDQYSALAKRKIANAIKMDIDADTAKNVCNAIQHEDGLANTILLCGGIKKIDFELTEREIPNITKYHDFAFDEPGEQGIRLRRHGNIGTGILIKPSSLKKYPEYVSTIMNRHQVTDDFKILKSTSTPYDFTSKAAKPSQSSDIEKEDSEFPGDPRVFQCQNPMCSRMFLTVGGLEAHQSRNPPNCVGRKRIETMDDFIKNRFIERFGITENPTTYRQSRRIVTHFEKLPDAVLFGGAEMDHPWEGKSLHEHTRSKNLNKNQVAYLTELFEDGMNSKKKARADIVEKEMRYVTKEDGRTLRFGYHEWIPEARIKSFFSRLAAKYKKGTITQVDRTAADTEPVAGPSNIASKFATGLYILNYVANNG